MVERLSSTLLQMLRTLEGRKWEAKVILGTESVYNRVKDPDGLACTVREQDKPKNKGRTLHRNNIMS